MEFPVFAEQFRQGGQLSKADRRKRTYGMQDGEREAAAGDCNAGGGGADEPERKLDIR